ncbi:asparaginase [Luminiphilus syltensis NOR5-1B]|uniref:Asparaginase n=1 Tax=Luminiphilus syltensis NOR5-1B TaxID=565045 RepID=B8KXA2_9GAMM|nr:asparaginase domain-containing protein [Luminiphilus syltensis]EED36124.1 asparaginase [Luminiphilus syltensis NOR5-1B]
MELHIITTGGTIDKTYFDAKSDYQVGAPVIGEMLDALGVHFPYTVESAMRKDSLDMDDSDREKIRACVNRCDEAHVLITHGTDGMVTTGKALQNIDNKIIVLTGALQPAAFRNSDAVFNIGCAIGALQRASPGVYIAVNGRVFDIDNVQKNVAKNRFEALISRTA